MSLKLGFALNRRSAPPRVLCKVCLALLLFAQAFACSSSDANGILDGQNLIVNESAEDFFLLDIFQPNGVADFPGWTRIGNVFHNFYADFPVFPVPPLGPPAPNFRDSYFLGGDQESTELNQTILVDSEASAIDAGEVLYDFSGWIGTLDQSQFAPRGPFDMATATALFRDNLNVGIGSAVLSPLTTDEAIEVGGTSMRLRTAAGSLPVGTRAVEINLAFVRFQGGINNGLVDELSFSLLSVPEPSAAVLALFAVGALTCRRPVKRRQLGAPLTIVLAVTGGISLCQQQSFAERVVWKIEDGGNGNAYEAVVPPRGVIWPQANLLATDAGGHLATIGSAAENEFVFDLIDAPEFWIQFNVCCNWGPWIGGLQDPAAVEPGEGWGWVTGEPFDYTNWAPGEPNEDSPDEDFLHFFGVDGDVRRPGWNDVPDSRRLRGYVVEFERVPEPATALLVLLAAGGLTCGRKMSRKPTGAIPALLLTAMVGVSLCQQKSFAERVVWKIEDGGNGNAYEAVVPPRGVIWPQANLLATDAGGHLATIGSAAENEFVFDLVDSPEFWIQFNDCCNWGPWIGGLQEPAAVEPAEGWGWVTGEPFDYTNWAPGEPNEFNLDEDNLHFFGIDGDARSPRWNDEQGSRRLRSYVVEFERVPEPATLLLAMLMAVGLFYVRAPRRFNGTPFCLTLLALLVTVDNTAHAAATLQPIPLAAFSGNEPIVDFGPTSTGVPVDGMTIDGVAFTFAIGNVPSTGAVINGGPGDTNHVTVANIEGSTAGVLGFTLPHTSSGRLGFGWAASALGGNESVRVELFDGNSASLGSLSMVGAPDPRFLGGFFGVQSDTSFASAEVTWLGAAPRFAFDNLRYEAVPEPSALLLALLGALGVGYHRHRK